MPGKARNPVLLEDVLRRTDLSTELLYALYSQFYSGPAGAAVTQSRQIGGTIGPSDSGADRLLRSGDTMIGPIAYYPIATLISGGIITVAENGGAFTSRVIAGTEGAAADDDLDTIAEAKHAGQYLILQGTLTQTIHIKHGTGNIRTLTGSDVDLVGNQNIILVFDSIANEWAQVSAPSGGGLTNPLTSDLDFGTFDALNIDRALFAVDSQVFGAPSSDYGILAASFGLRYNVPSGLAHRLDIAGVNEYSFNTGSADFQGNALNDVADILFTVAAHTIISDTSQMAFNVDNSDVFRWLIGGALAMELGVTQLDLKGRILTDVNDIRFSTGGLEIRDNSGGLEYDVNPGDSHEFKVSGIDELTISSANINFRGNDAFDVGDIDFSISGQTLLSDTSGLHLFLPSSDIFELFINSIKIFDFDSGGLNMAANMDIALDVSGYLQFGSTSSSASSGAQSLPSNPAGFFWVKEPGGAFRKVPYYNV